MVGWWSNEAVTIYAADGQELGRLDCRITPGRRSWRLAVPAVDDIDSWTNGPPSIDSIDMPEFVTLDYDFRMRQWTTEDHHLLTTIDNFLPVAGPMPHPAVVICIGEEMEQRRRREAVRTARELLVRLCLELVADDSDPN